MTESATSRLEQAPPPSIDELLTIEVFADLPPDGLHWLASHMNVIDIAAGEAAIRSGEPAEHMIALFSGELRGELLNGRVFTSELGQVTGLLPFSRMSIYTVDVRATLPSRFAALHKQHFPAMLERLPQLQGRLVGLLADRIRETAAAEQQREKLISLGKLSAGLAHELNNPASAARRAADNLRRSLASVRAASLKLDRDGLPLESRLFLTELETDWAKEAGPQTPLDTLDRSDREDDLSAWLEEHKIQAVWDIASPLVEVGCTRDTLETVARHVPSQFLNDVLIRLTAAFTISRLADEIESATGRISELVRAVKEYSYMDQMSQQQDIDIHQGIENTLLMLRYKLKNGIDIVRQYDRSLPHISARGGELNQVWTNLIVNAIYAMQGTGKLTIRTLRDNNFLRVEVVDNGPGISAEVKEHMFEPFFTTKPASEGTGLGLDIVRRIIRNHGGDVSFESQPGATTFSVRLPLTTGKS